MKACARNILISLSFGAAVLAALPAQAQLYFSEDSNSTGLYLLDTTTGAATNLGDSGVTSSTVGLAPSGTPGVLFGTQFADLLEIQADGSGSVVIGGDGQEGLAFDASTGTLYGAINGAFTTIDPATGLNSSTLAGPGADVEGIAFGNGGVYGLPRFGTDLLFYDPGTDSWSTIGSTGITWDLAGLAYDPGTDTLYAKGTQDTNLYAIDPATAATTVIGDTGLTAGGGLAFLGSGMPPIPDARAVPTLDRWGLMVLLLLIGGIAALTLTRR